MSTSTGDPIAVAGPRRPATVGGERDRRDRAVALALAIGRRTLEAAVTLLIASILVWSLAIASPGNSAQRAAHARGELHPTTAQIAALEHELGLDRSPVVQYVHWLGGVLHGDLGISYVSGSPVADEIAERIGPTLVLALAGLVVSLLIALPSALLSARYPGGRIDRALGAFSQLNVALPSFVLALLLIEVVVVRAGWGEVITDGTWRDVALPALCLGLAPGALWARVLRSLLIDVGRQRWVGVVRARGATEWRILIAHVLPAALPPFLQTASVGVAGLLGGAPVIEMVFSWPGIGAHAVSAIESRDVPVIQAVTLLATTGFVVISLLTDVVSYAIDPRTRPR